MKALNSMNSKTVLTKVSSGWTTQRFLDEYGITQEVFDKKIKEIFPHRRGRDDVLRNLMQNDKRIDRVQNSQSKRRKVMQSYASDFGNFKSQTLENPSQKTYQSEEKTVEQVVIEDKVTFLNDCILAVDRDLSELLAEYEAAVNKKEKVLLLQRKQIETAIAALERSLSEKRKELNQILKDISTEEAKIEELEESIAIKKQKIDEFETEIRQLTKLQLFAYEDGTIEIDQFNGEVIYTTSDSASTSFEMNNEEFGKAWKAEYKRLSNPNEISTELDEALENMTRREIKQLSKIIALVSHITQMGSMYDITFECERVQKTWALCLA